ncbi:MAG: hypothetical protein QOF70_3002 [Acetobacteraceae bacterium]|jgi:hypothetical protein|nr:hypothetical protein [Acetobacteraceae bacterium]
MNLTNFQQLVTRLLIGLETRPECADADPLGPELYWHGTTRTVDGSVAVPGDRGRRATKYSFHLVSLTQLFYGDRAAGHNCRAVANGVLLNLCGLRKPCYGAAEGVSGYPKQG